MTTKKRQKQYQKNQSLEELLKEINGILNPVENKLLKSYTKPKYPVLFVVGMPRSGSTLVMQWLAKTNKFAYPTNFLSRFYQAPYIGAKIQLLLTDPRFNFNNEILDFNNEISFSSNLGKTQGALAPNEFWYFWRRFIPNVMPEHLDEEALQKIDSKNFVAELAAIEAVFDKPLTLKGHILELNTPFLNSILDNVLFLFIKRNPFYNIQSLLEARVKFFGDRKNWYSIKPPQYNFLKDLTPIEQVAGQVYFCNSIIEAGLNQLNQSKWIQVDYEIFCADPEQVFNQIKEKFAEQGFKFNWVYEGLQHFQTTNQIRLSKEDCNKIIESYNHFSGIDITL